MTNVLEQIVQQVAYMFYEKEKTMVIIGLLELGRQVNLDELSNILKFRKNDLAKVLGALKQDRLIHIEAIEDFDDDVDPETLTKAQRNKYIKDFYSLDFKSFVDSVNLKILRAREQLKVRCGSEDNIFYECPQCNTRYPLQELVSLGIGDEGMICTHCNVALKELDDSDELNHKTKVFKDFVERTKPLLDLIKQTAGLVMINDTEERCKSDRMIPENEYNEIKTKILHDISIQKMTNRQNSSSQRINANLKPDDIAVAVISKKNDANEQPQVSKSAVEIIKEQKKQETERANMKKETINIKGKDYTAEEITDELLDSLELDDEEYERVLLMKERNS